MLFYCFRILFVVNENFLYEILLKTTSLFRKNIYYV